MSKINWDQELFKIEEEIKRHKFHTEKKPQKETKSLVTMSYPLALRIMIFIVLGILLLTSILTYVDDYSIVTSATVFDFEVNESIVEVFGFITPSYNLIEEVVDE